jgi:hypothetical protein
VTFTINSITRCAGGGHYDVTITLGNGQSGTLHTTKDELAGDPPASIAEARDAVLDRIRSALKEANAATWANIQSALVGQTFKV